jgi:hypothetical protein
MIENSEPQHETLPWQPFLDLARQSSRRQTQALREFKPLARMARLCDAAAGETGFIRAKLRRPCSLAGAGTP